MAQKAKTTSRKRRVKKNIASGVAHVHSTFNNTIVTITDEAGNVIAWSSAGALGYKGSRKSTPYAAQLVSEAAGKTAMDHGMRKVEVKACLATVQHCIGTPHPVAQKPQRGRIHVSLG